VCVSGLVRCGVGQVGENHWKSAGADKAGSEKPMGGEDTGIIFISGQIWGGELSMTSDSLASPFKCGDCLYFDRKYGTDEGWCKYADSDHYCHLVRASHPAPMYHAIDSNGDLIIHEGEQVMEFCFSSDELVKMEEEDGGHA